MKIFNPGFSRYQPKPERQMLQVVVGEVFAETGGAVGRPSALFPIYLRYLVENCRSICCSLDTVALRTSNRACRLRTLAGSSSDILAR